MSKGDRTFNPQRADYLPNGARILKRRKHDDGWLIIGYTRGSSYQPYVTWKMDCDGRVYWGNYFENYFKASEDFDNRAGLTPIA